MTEFKYGGAVLVTYDFCVGAWDDCSDDKAEEVFDDLMLLKGDSLEYFFTRNDGFHYVHSSKYEIGFWVSPNFIDIGDSESFKPKTKVEYTELSGEQKLSELFRLYEDEVLYTKSMGKYLQVLSVESVIKLQVDRGAFKKVETEVTWRDEANCKYPEIMGSLNDSFYSEDIIKYCHLVASLTFKPLEANNE